MTDAKPARPLAYLPTLDGWRAIAIALVLVGHSAHSLHTFGYLGVQIFFGLSGLLITSRLLDEEQRHGRTDLNAFYVRRARRILPAAVFFTLCAGALGLLGVFPLTFGRWITSIIPISNYSTADRTWYLGHFWSLAVEEHFYLVWPALFVLCRRPAPTGSRVRIAVALALALAVALWRAIDFRFHVTASAAGDPEYFWGRTDIQADGLLWGVIVALAFATWPGVARYLTHVAARAAVAAVAVACTFVDAGDWKINFALITVRAICVPLLLLGSSQEDPRGVLGRVLESKPLKTIGLLSYSLYLWQQLFFAWEDQKLASLSVVQTLPINIACVLGAAALSYYMIERPFLAHKR